MHDFNPHRWTLPFLAICLLLSPVASAEDAPVDENQGRSLVLGFVKAGATLGWDMGGIGSIGVLIGSPTARLHLAVRAFAGMSTGDSDPSLAGGAEIGYRGIWPVHPKFRLTVLAAGSYMYRRARTPQTDTVYLYHIPQGHLYVGLMFGRHPRRTHGVEIGGSAGWAIHTNPGEGSKDYTGFYGQAELSYVLTF